MLHRLITLLDSFTLEALSKVKRCLVMANGIYRLAGAPLSLAIEAAFGHAKHTQFPHRLRAEFRIVFLGSLACLR